MTIELNKDALKAAFASYDKSGTLHDAIVAYLESVEAQKTPKSQPFDPALVKPGDEVLLDILGRNTPVKYIGRSSTGSVVVEGKAGNVQVCSASELTIPPAPRKTVKVAVFKGGYNTLPFPDTHVFGSPEGWTRISDWVEIEINERNTA